MAEKTIQERLDELKQKRDHVGDLFGAADVHTLVEAIEYAMSHGGDVSVAVTPVGNGYKITVTDSEGNVQEATVQNGGDAYAVYVSTVPEDQTPMSKTAWLASLKGDNAVNPFKGWFDDASYIPTTDAKVGDYAYVKGATSSDPAAIYAWDGDSWEDTGRTADTSNVQTFETGQAVNAVGIDASELKNAGSSDLPKATNVQLLKQQLRGVTLEETKASTGTLQVGVLNAKTKLFVGTSGTARYAVIPLNGATSVRFLGVSYGDANTSYYYGYGFYNASNEVFWAKAYEGRNDSGSNVTKEYVEEVPEGAVSLICSVILASNMLNESNFYCYLENGNTVVEMMPEVVDNLRTNDASKALSAKQGKELDEKIYGVVTEIEEPIDLTTNNYYNTKIDNDGTWKYRTSVGDGYVAFGTVYKRLKVKVSVASTAGNYARKILFTKRALPTATEGDTSFQDLKEGGYLCNMYQAASDIATLGSPNTVGYFDVPEDAVYVYFTVIRSTTKIVSSASVLSNVRVGGDLNKIVEDKPQNLGVAMAIKKAYDLINLQYMLREDLPSAFAGHYANVDKGDVVKSILYSSTRKTHTFVPNAVSIETFLSAISDKDSVQYTEPTGLDTGASALYYGIVCGMFSAYCLGIKVLYDMNFQWFSIPGMVLVDNQDANAVQLGDIINDATNSHTHCMICVGIKRNNGTGDVVSVTMAESLYNHGNTPICQATEYTARQFNNMLAAKRPNATASEHAYTLIRYTRLHENSYDGSIVKKYIINKNIMPRRGNKSIYGVNEEIWIDLLNTTGYTQYKLYRNDTLVSTTDIPSTTHIALDNAVYGKYKLVLTDGTHDSLPVEWMVVDATVTYEVIDDSKIKIYFSSKNAEALSAHWSNTNWMNFADFELTDADIDNGYIVTELSQEPNLVNNNPRYAGRWSMYDSLHDYLAQDTDIYPRVCFVTEFGMYFSPRGSAVKVYQNE